MIKLTHKDRMVISAVLLIGCFLLLSIDHFLWQPLSETNQAHGAALEEMKQLLTVHQ